MCDWVREVDGASFDDSDDDRIGGQLRDCAKHAPLDRAPASVMTTPATTAQDGHISDR
jgi:hypothetical protein